MVGVGRVAGTMKNIDIKSLLIGALFTSTVIFGVAAVSGPASGKVQLDGPVDVRLSFGSSKPSSSNTSTPTALEDDDTLKVKLSTGILVLGGAVDTD